MHRNFLCYFIILCILPLTISDETISQPTSSKYKPVDIPPSILRKSIVNYGQLTPTVRHKLQTNQCIDWIAIGTSVTCVGGHNPKSPDRPTKFSDGWHYQLSEYLKHQSPVCYRGTQPSQHRLLEVRCYNKGAQFPEEEVGTVTKIEKANIMHAWIESIQIERRTSDALLLQADLFIVESVDDQNEEFTARETEQFIYSIATLPAQPTLIFLAASFMYLADETRIWATLDKSLSSLMVQHVPNNRNFDSVLYQLPIAQHYGIPYVSAIDALGPFLTPESKAWLTDKYVFDGKCHLTKTGHKIVASLLLNYLNIANASVHQPFFSEAGEEAMFLNVSSIVPVYHMASDLNKLVSEPNPPLVIMFTCDSLCYSMWMIDGGVGWEVHRRVYGIESDMWIDVHKRGISSSVIGGPPFTIVIPHESLQVHFVKQILRFRVAKSRRFMGKLRIAIRVFGHDKELTETVIDCLLPNDYKGTNDGVVTGGIHNGNGNGDGNNNVDGHANRNAMGNNAGDSKSIGNNVGNNAGNNAGHGFGDHQYEKLVESIKNNDSFDAAQKTLLYLDLQGSLSSQIWFDEEIHLNHKLKPTDSLEISLSVVASSPARVDNAVKIGSVILN